MKSTEIDKDEIINRFSYNKKTGIIYWTNGRRAGKEAFTYTSKRGYRATTFRGVTFETTLSAHRVAWLLHTGEWPSGQIDHINGDKVDNRILNLRDVVNAENARNCCLRSTNKSGVPGVYVHSQTGKWTAQINAFGKTVGLGCFGSKSDAIIARKSAERVLGYHKNHGRHA
tara:strand:+ start:686 stop:1198 length:513 start_codon:yes stop_codon:yes gene_type:complete